MKMLVSLIAVCLMVAVEAYSHKEYAPYGYPMDDVFPERHGMHREPQMYGDPHMYRDSQMHRDSQMYRDPNFYGPANPASNYQDPSYDRHHDRHHYGEPSYEVPYYRAHNNGLQPHMRSECEPNHYPNERSRCNMNYDNCSKKRKPVHRNSEQKSCSNHKNYTPDNHGN